MHQSIGYAKHHRWFHMWTFHRAVLMGGVGTGGVNIMTKLLEQDLNLGVVVQFAILIHMDVLVRKLRYMTDQPLLEPVGRSAFRYSNSTIKCTGKMVFDHNEVGFTTETLVSGGTSFFLGRLSSEGKVNREPLPRDGSIRPRGMIRPIFLHLSRQTGGAVIKNPIRVLECR